jgi:hypothetical protein
MGLVTRDQMNTTKNYVCFGIFVNQHSFEVAVDISLAMISS